MPDTPSPSLFLAEGAIQELTADDVVVLHIQEGVPLPSVFKLAEEVRDVLRVPICIDLGQLRMSIIHRRPEAKAPATQAAVAPIAVLTAAEELLKAIDRIGAPPFLKEAARHLREALEP